ncbi:MAG: TraB/GumN family protein [Gammaproteobacteria bacterium]|nr:TraB/GumN family protein [Gammaproteobacteria bacterium]
MPTGQTLAASLPADTVKALDGYLAGQGGSVAALAQLKPSLVATQLAVARLTGLGYFAAFGLDQYYMARAETRPILELERVEDQMALLTSPPMDVQADMVKITLEQMDEIEAMVADMVVAWLSGDDVALRALFDEQSPQTEAYQAFNRRLLDDRNVGMATTIQGYLATPGTYFVLVGAAHLAGPGSIVDVLQSRGVGGKRIYSDDTW